jgi:hypothetical protein
MSAALAEPIAEPPASRFRAREWEGSYWAPQERPDGTVVDILRDFYIPALSASRRYDRLTGFFSSTALVSAEAGYAALAAAGGKARIIAGVDLNNPGDLDAIFEGETLRNRILSEFGPPGAFPFRARPQDRLRWAVASGLIEFRFAIRVHQESGEPLPYGDSSDGYAHTKMASFEDADGDFIFMSGSLNESRTALEVNSENIEVDRSWAGGVKHIRMAHYLVPRHLKWKQVYRACRR